MSARYPSRRADRAVVLQMLRKREPWHAYARLMRVGLLTREWPPDVYGGAGVHVYELTEHLRRLVEVDVHCFGEPRSDAIAHAVPPELATANPAVQTLGVDMSIVAQLGDVDIVHSHTWYTNLAGQLGSRLLDIPHILTAHSLEPLRPWKLEQLQGGYRLSSWIEEVSYAGAARIIAVSHGMARDIRTHYPFVAADRIRVVHNGIDTEAFRPDPSTTNLERLGIDPSHSYALFVGRITRQKGLEHLIAAARHFDPDVHLVICASAPDTPELGRAIAEGISHLADERGPDSVTWIREHVDRSTLVPLLSHATVFVCPSIYEPLGIVNLEAMACQTAVVASAVGGIPEVVVDGRTGLLVPYDPEDVPAFERGIATAVNALFREPQTAAAMGAAGRARAIEDFSWQTIAEQTLAVYEDARASI